MNTHKLLRRGALAGLLCLATFAGIAALEKGGKAFAKRNETPLLAEPRPLAAATGTVGFAEVLAIEEVRGSWLRVKAKKTAGWVFAGNVAADKPTTPPPAGLTTVAASETTTAAAARPLAPAAEGFADRHDAGKARADVEWLDRESARVTAAQVEAYLRDNQKGEYQP